MVRAEVPGRESDAVPQIAELIARADALLITAGAGMSVDSAVHLEKTLKDELPAEFSRRCGISSQARFR